MSFRSNKRKSPYAVGTEREEAHAKIDPKKDNEMQAVSDSKNEKKDKKNKTNKRRTHKRSEDEKNVGKTNSFEGKKTDQDRVSTKKEKKARGKRRRNQGKTHDREESAQVDSPEKNDGESVEDAVQSSMILPTTAENTVDDADDSDDEDLQAMAAAWAESKASDGGGSAESTDDETVQAPSTHQKPRKAKRPDREQELATKPQRASNNDNDLTLHVSQLPFETTEWEIRQYFAQHAGCSLTDVRMVKDPGIDGKPAFRGVAFCKCPTSGSYEAALRLHQSPQYRLDGRRLNIRPAVTKAELANIVEQRNVLVQAKLESLLARRNDDQQESATRSTRHKRKGKHQSGGKGGSKTRRTDPQPKRSTEESSHSPPTAEGQNRQSKDPDTHKLTKKERNRRAAIIMAKRRRRK